MKKRRRIYHAPVLHFKRWSRKSYSAFVSMNRVVNISRLAVHVADPLVRKTNKFHKIALSQLAIFAFMSHQISRISQALDTLLASPMAITVPLSDASNSNLNFYNNIGGRASARAVF